VCVSELDWRTRRSDHTTSAEASRDAQADRRMTENRVRSVGAVVKKSEINCKTTAWNVTHSNTLGAAYVSPGHPLGR
jgi:hypothetical protein